MSTTQHPTDGTPIKDVPKVEEVKVVIEEEPKVESKAKK